MTNAPARNRANVTNAASISASVLASKTWICLPSVRAAASTSFTTTDSERLEFVGLMSALGQERTLRHVRSMSALPPKADIRRPVREEIPLADAVNTLAFLPRYTC
jgi:hypothetical protein